MSTAKAGCTSPNRSACNATCKHMVDSESTPSNSCNFAGALKSLDELSEERGNLEKAFRWEWDNDDVLKGRTPSGINPNQMLRDGLKRYAQSSLLANPNKTMVH